MLSELRFCEQLRTVGHKVTGIKTWQRTRGDCLLLQYGLHRLGHSKLLQVSENSILNPPQVCEALYRQKGLQNINNCFVQAPYIDDEWYLVVKLICTICLISDVDEDVFTQIIRNLNMGARDGLNLSKRTNLKTISGFYKTRTTQHRPFWGLNLSKRTKLKTISGFYKTRSTQNRPWCVWYSDIDYYIL